MPEPKSPSTQPAVWRSLDEWAETGEFQEWLHREFPENASEWLADQTSRREFLRLMGASLALAGFAGCDKPLEEKIVPPIRIPEYAPGGKSLYFATTMPTNGGGMGLLVESRDGRPIKIEGNSLHPASLGATDAFAQAALLGLYDPDRSQVFLQNRQIGSRDVFFAELNLFLSGPRARNGRGFRVLSPPVISPTLARQRRQLLEKLPEARWHTYEPFHNEEVRQGSQLAFGEDLFPHYRLRNADIVLSIDSDILGTGAGKIANARGFAERRQIVGADAEKMMRLYAVESTPTLTGSVSDHRWPLSPAAIRQFVLLLAAKLGLPVDSPPSSIAGITDQQWNALVSDLSDTSNKRLVTCGVWQPAEVQALVHAINGHINAIGDTVVFTKTPDEEQNPADRDHSISALVEAMKAGDIETLILLECNPVFDAPADLQFEKALDEVEFKVHYNQYRDETSRHCDWHVPAMHFLETWGDVRAFDGTASLIQPLIDPLYSSISVYELMNAVLDNPDQSAQDTLKETWRELQAEEPFEVFWRKALHDGVIPNTKFEENQPTPGEGLFQNVQEALAEQTAPKADALTAVFRPHPTLWDGRFANNGWLQELPQPFTKLTWGNAALISVQTADELGLRDGDVVEISREGTSLEIPILRVSGQAEFVITLHFGTGRKNVGQVGEEIGTNIYPIRTSNDAWVLEEIQLTKTGRRVKLPTTQLHFLMEGRDLLRMGTQIDYLSNPEHPPFMHTGHGHSGQGEELPTLYDDGKEHEFLNAELQWGMSVNPGTCIGCNACVVACQAENNIPIVGPEGVQRGREMHWLRIDTYYAGEPEHPEIYHQPMACVHCEHAPCEVVCPVAATTHSAEGINEMTYNRCIGTRYCSNNCPYKVRRFNYFDYNQQSRELPVLQLLHNPEVTVRSRGVMEKCTYCIQRLNHTRIQAEMDGVDDWAKVSAKTACQEVCPTNAITFGNLRNKDSQVVKEKESPLSYGVLADLNTRPRTTYLAAVRNPHETLARKSEGHS